VSRTTGARSRNPFLIYLRYWPGPVCPPTTISVAQRRRTFRLAMISIGSRVKPRVSQRCREVDPDFGTGG
jgi:hypothetical protein